MKFIGWGGSCEVHQVTTMDGRMVHNKASNRDRAHSLMYFQTKQRNENIPSLLWTQQGKRYNWITIVSIILPADYHTIYTAMSPRFSCSILPQTVLFCYSPNIAYFIKLYLTSLYISVNLCIWCSGRGLVHRYYLFRNQIGLCFLCLFLKWYIVGTSKDTLRGDSFAAKYQQGTTWCWRCHTL
jgi:hypothetical protein